MSQDQQTPKPKRRISWRGVLLIVSLGLNLLVVGMVAGAVLGKGPHRELPALRSLGYGPYISALPDDALREMRGVVAREQGSFRENRRKMREEFEALLALLRAETVDEGALRQAIESQRNRVTERLALGSELVIAQLVAMTPEDRMAYADRLDKLMKRRGKPKDGPRD
jgi:uncharacterized membrane protein